MQQADVVVQGPFLELVQGQAMVGLQDMQDQGFDDLSVGQVLMPFHGAPLIDDVGDAQLAADGQDDAEIRWQAQVTGEHIERSMLGLNVHAPKIANNLDNV